MLVTDMCDGIFRLKSLGPSFMSYLFVLFLYYNFYLFVSVGTEVKFLYIEKKHLNKPDNFIGSFSDLSFFLILLLFD